MSLPPTSENLWFHILRAHLQVMLQKAADKSEPPEASENILMFGWKFSEDNLPIPVYSSGNFGPPELIDIIKCQCKVVGKKCSTEICSCHKHHLSCTTYCKCAGEDGCLNPYSTKVLQSEVYEDSVLSCDGSDLEEDVSQRVNESYLSDEGEEQTLEDEFLNNIEWVNDL